MENTNIPDKWCIRITEENYDEFKAWAIKMHMPYLANKKDCDIYFNYPDYFGDNKNYFSYSKIEEYALITTEHLLKIEIAIKEPIIYLGELPVSKDVDSNISALENGNMQKKQSFFTRLRTALWESIAINF